VKRRPALSDDEFVMRAWIGRFIRRASVPLPPLSGAASAPRVKRYTAESGYVYEYFHQGYRDEHEARRHFFQVSPDRKTWFEIQVAIDGSGIRAWELDNSRELNHAERYAVAKLALFGALDEGESPAAVRTPVLVRAEGIARLLASIDI